MNRSKNRKGSVTLKISSLQKLACLTALVAGPSFANIVSNGSFEQGVFAPVSLETESLIPGGTAVSGWEVINGAVAWIGAGNPWLVTAQDGDRFLDLTDFDVGPLGGVRQTLITTPGRTYKVDFYLGGSGYYGNSALTVSAAGKSVTFGAAAPYNNWQAFSFNFVAANPTTELSFIGALGPHYIGLDNVSVEAVPEPGTLALCLTAGGFLGLGRLRRRQA